MYRSLYTALRFWPHSFVAVVLAMLNGNLLSFGSVAFCTVTFQADICCKAPDSQLLQPVHLSFLLHGQSLSWCCFPVSALAVLPIASHYALLTTGRMLGIPVTVSWITNKPYSQLTGYQVKLEKSFILLRMQELYFCSVLKRSSRARKTL